MNIPKIFILPWYIKYFGFIMVAVSFLNAGMQKFSNREISFFSLHSDTKVFAVYAMLLFGLSMITFSKEKTEDEFFNYLRLRSLLFTVALHSLFFLVASFTNLTLYLINFPAIILMDSILIIYIITFYIQKLVDFQSSKNEESN
jgi:hypothetical protein